MYLKLRILFTILAVLCVAALLPIGSIFGFMWAGICALFAFLFFGLMWLCKQNQEMQERKEEEKKKTDTQNKTE
jgi:hypothetical protein